MIEQEKHAERRAMVKQIIDGLERESASNPRRTVSTQPRPQPNSNWPILATSFLSTSLALAFFVPN